MNGAEGWTLRNTDRQKIEAAELGFYRRLLKKLGVNRELYAAVVKRKKGFFGYTTRS